MGPVRYFWPAVPLRNLVFLIIVLLHGLLDALHIDQCRAVGISTGGMTLLHMATSQAKRVESMALVGATHFFPVDSREIMASVQFDKLTDEELLLRSLHKHGDEQIRIQFWGSYRL